MSKIVFRTPYDDDYVDPGPDIFDPDTGEVQLSLTVQSEKDNCDINKILAKHQKTGLLPVMSGNAMYGDLPDPVSYQEALNLVIEAQNSFSSLDAEIRDRFANDPARFLEFVENPKNSDELRSMGLSNAPLVVEGVTESPPREQA